MIEEHLGDRAESYAAKLEFELLRSVRKISRQATNDRIVLTKYDGQGNLIGGLVGSTSYGWLLIKILWIDELRRRDGIATALLEDALGLEREIGCHAAWLDTSNADAKAFYRM